MRIEGKGVSGGDGGGSEGMERGLLATQGFTNPHEKND